MTVKLKLFASLRETIGQSELNLETAPTDRMIDVWHKLVQSYPDLAQWEGRLGFACNLEFVEPDRELKPGDEIAFIPPVSGG